MVDKSESARRNRPVLSAAILIIELIGLAISLYLTYLHLTNPKDPVCNINQELNCTAVIFSRYGYLFGVPTAWYGVLTYIALIVLTFMGRAPERGRVYRNAPLYIFAIAVWNILYSIVMAGISTFILKQYCVNCIGLYFVNIGLLATSWAWSGDVEGGRAATLLDDAKDGVKELWVWAVVCFVGLILAGSYAFWSVYKVPGNGEAPANAVRAPALVKEYIDEYPHKGPANAPVTIVEFSDLKCPHCARTHKVFKEGMKKYGDKFRLYFVHYPLDNECNKSLSRAIHPGACHATYAARCAQKEGKFWEYVEILFSHQNDVWSDDALTGYGRQVGLDPARLKACMADPETRKFIVEKNVKPGEKVPIQFTPTIFMNGVQAGSVGGGLDSLLKELEKALMRPGEGPNSAPKDAAAPGK